MKKDDLKTLIRSGTKKNESLLLSDLSVIKSVANVMLEIDRETNEYYYKVKLDDLVDKEFDSSVLSDNKWELSLDEEYIFLFL